MTANVVTDWKELGLQDLFYAYRKAKVDCFKFTDVKCIASRIVDFETELPQHLQALLIRLRSGEIRDILAENLGDCRLVSKKLSIGSPKKEPASSPHGYFSDPDRAFINLNTSNKIIPEFRLVGDFPITMHILSALWINTVGHKFDAILSDSAYGSRLRRYRSAPSASQKGSGSYHIEATGSFQPYFSPYKRWRENGLTAIREELMGERSVIAISMDLTSYYHNIDPSFICNHDFLRSAGITLSAWELKFTSEFALALKLWAKKVPDWLEQNGCVARETQLGGVPIGLSMARVVANSLLMGLDRSIEQGLAPVYYGRYVDDIFLVLRDPGNIKNSEELLSYISERSKCFPKEVNNEKKGEVRLTLPGDYQGKTRLILKQDKQKIFFLRGQGGIDLLDNIETQIRSVSSERRMMPSPKRLESMASARVLTAAGHPSEEADTLRKADGLVVRRLGWSIQLRAVEILARDLRQGDWIEERKKFYQFAHSHILRPDKILDHMDYLPRLLSLAVSLMDWEDAQALVNGSLRSLETLRKVESEPLVVNGSKISGNGTRVWHALEKTLLDLAAEAILRSLRWSQRSGGMRPLSDAGTNLCEQVGLGSDFENIQTRSRAMRECDWAKLSYKDHLRRDALRQRPLINNEAEIYGLYPHEQDLRIFLHNSTEVGMGSGASRVNSRCLQASKESATISLTPYLFPTRPYSTQEVSLFLPTECVFEQGQANPARKWALYVRAVRGVWVKASLVTPEVSKPEVTNTELQKSKTLRLARIGTKKMLQPRLGISSLLTSNESFRAAAVGRQDISRERYERVERIINQAIKAHPKPTHLLLPELSLPDRWIETTSSLLRDAGISLIAGLDYHHEKPDLIHSEATLVLNDDRLGFPASVQIRQQKSQAAAGEEHDLLKTFGQTWTPQFLKHEKPVYIHNGFSFGVLICSELQNMKHRLAFQGAVDCLMILSWNKDLDTFSALVESASLDVHAHVALVNNRLYGDSRVRAPAKENYGRDLCRVRGGENEHVVVVAINVEPLRAFQNRATRWPSPSDSYKPVPEGFSVASYRRTTPK